MRRSPTSNTAKVLEAAAHDASVDPSEPRHNAEERSKVLASLITELGDLDSTLLRKRWRSLMRTSAPRGLSRTLMIRILAWREQVVASGDLDRKTLAMLHASIGQGKGSGATPAPIGNQLRPGMVLVREHAGVLHRVVVLADGFGWNGRSFGSLSAVARDITGVNWNGPRFFGLDQPSSKQSVRQNSGNAKSRSPTATAPPSADICSPENAKAIP